MSKKFKFGFAGIVFLGTNGTLLFFLSRNFNALSSFENLAGGGGI